MKKEMIAPHVKDITRALGNEVSKEQIEEELLEAVNDFGMGLSQAKRTILKKHGGKAQDLREWIKLKLSEVRDGDTEIELLCRVVYASRKQISGKSGESKEIISGILGDDTTTRPFTSWKTTGVELNVGDVVRLKNVYVTDWRGEPQINIGDYTVIEKAASSDLPSYNSGAPKGEAVEKKLAEIEGSERNLTLTGKIITVNKRTTVKDGTERTFFYGLIGDDTATIPFTAWKDFSLSRDQVIRVEGAYATTWKERPQVNFSDRSTVSVLDEDMETLPAQFSTAEAVDSKIKDISGSGSRVNVVGRILSLEEREIDGENGPRTMKTGILSDGTAKIGFTAWGEFPYGPGDAVEIKGARVRYWRNRPQLSIDDNAPVSKAAVELPSLEELDAPKVMDIDSIIRLSGAMDVSVTGVIMDIKNGSGLIDRCPVCRKVLQDGICTTHGEVGGVPDMRVKCILDDGTGTMNVVLNRALTEQVLGMSMDDAIKLAMEKRNFSAVQKEVENRLLVKMVTIRGDVVLDDYGLSSYARELSFPEIDVEEEARKLLEEVEA